MKLIFTILIALLFNRSVTAQATLLNSNNSLTPVCKLNSTKALLKSIDGRLWVTDGTAAGTLQLSTTLTYERSGAVLNGKFIFPGITAATGNELWITDGTIAGTTLLKDINPGIESSFPDDDFALLNDHLYFAAHSPGFGRELWKTDGTPDGTSQVKDIMAGPGQSALRGKYRLFSTGTYLLLNVATYNEGYELWKSDGTENGTSLLKDINPGAAPGDPESFVLFNNIVLFAAKHDAYGLELWKTDGTPAGTELVKDIRSGPTGSFYYLSIFQFNGRGYFTANDGVVGEEIWSTDGTAANTVLLKDIEPGSWGSFSALSLSGAVKMNNKFIFPAYQHATGVELWESDGTGAGTKMLKEIAVGMEMGIPIVLTPYDIDHPGQQRLFQGNRFFFIMILPASGSALWASDGTEGGTVKIKDINPNEVDGLEHFSYTYSQHALYFTADNGLVGDELWTSNGTTAGTGFLADINPGSGHSEIGFSYISVNNKLLFEAQNGDHPNFTDFYSLDLTNNGPLPVRLYDFTVTARQADAFIQWSTLQEINTKDFTIERSYDATRFEAIGSVAATGTSEVRRNYSFFDRNIKNSGREVVYYRLRSNDIDGHHTISKVISLRFNQNGEWSVRLNENPVSNALYLTLAGNTANIQFSIHDFTGRTVYQGGPTSASGLVALPVANLPAGTYVLIAATPDDRKAVRFLKR
jgi:ELWxxDGT repeat protein